jgi:hypothetical protein
VSDVENALPGIDMPGERLISRALEAPVKYLILIYHNPQARQIWETFSDEERASGLQVYAALNEELAASGELIVTEALADATEARTIAVRDGQTISRDGPFAEVKEQLAGFYLVECASIARASEIAARIPEAGMGLIEVRPILRYSGLEM